MKLLLAHLFLALPLIASAAPLEFDVPTLSCSGVDTQTGGAVRAIRVRTDVDHSTLNVAFFPLNHPQPEPSEEAAYAITQIRPMFPVYSIQAEGDETKVSLAIRTEHGTPESAPSKLTIQLEDSSESGRLYNLNCNLSQP